MALWRTINRAGAMWINGFEIATWWRWSRWSRVTKSSDDAARASGSNQFDDLIEDNHPLDWRVNSVLIPAEVDALEAVLRLMDAASSETPKMIETDGLIESGWRRRVKPVACDARGLMSARGPFSADEEETESPPNRGSRTHRR